MKKDIEQYELIERYLKNELSDEETQKVKQQIHTDKEFAGEVKQHENLMNFITEGSLLQVKSSIENIHSNFNRTFLRKIINNRPLLYTLTGLVLLTLTVFYFLSNNETKELAENKIIPIAITSYTKTGEEKIEIKTPGQKQFLLIKSEIKKKTNPEEVTVDIKKTQPEIDPIVKTDSQIKNETIEVDQKQNREIIEPEKKKEPTNQDIVIADYFDCSQIKIAAEVTVENSCIREATGSIAIDQNKIEGGTPPYKLSIDNKKTYQSELRIDQLYAGSYTLSLTDKNKCSEKIGTYWVNAIDCDGETNEYIFAPDKQEKWKIPSMEGAQSIKVYNQQGMLVYELEISDNATYYWDGNSLSGNELPMGIYSFIIKCSEKKDVTGNVTIVK